MAAAIKPVDAHFARSRLLCLENTWSGHVMPMPYLQQTTDWARQRGLATHLDGARVMNAAVAQAQTEGSDAWTELRRIADLFDSVSICLSKGLGAPVGSVLCGSSALMAKAHRWRKVLGGGLRQSGVLAAAAWHALDHHVPGLAQDHALAQRLATGLQGLPGMAVVSAQTNIVFLDVANGLAPELLAHLRQDGVLATGMARLRLVTHLDVNAADIDQALVSMQAFAATHAERLRAQP
jgi:threonine aldolase